MLSFDHRREGIGYLESYLDKREMALRILENLESGIEADDVLKNHIEYCLQNKITDGIRFALEEIKKSSRSYEIRNFSLKTVVQLSDELSEIEMILPDISDEFKWNIVEELVNQNSKMVVDYLEDVLSTGNDKDKIKASEYLIKLQNIEALEYYSNWIKNNNQLNRDMYNSSTLTYLKNIAAIPILIDLLELTYKETFNQPDIFDRLDSLVQGALKSIALESEINYLKVRQAILDFIERNMNIYKNVNWLYSFLNQLEQQYYINKSEKIDVNDVINKLESIGL